MLSHSIDTILIHIMSARGREGSIVLEEERIIALTYGSGHACILKVHVMDFYSILKVYHSFSKNL